MLPVTHYRRPSIQPLCTKEEHLMTLENEPLTLFEQFNIARKAFDEAENKLISANDSGKLNEKDISELIENV